MKAVAYARYSSDNQRQESITAQLREIYDYANRNDIVIVKNYVDEALSAKSDERENFQLMIDELALLAVDYVLVHKVDRFARNKYDAAFYRREIKKARARLIAVQQDFGEGPEAELVEGIMDGFAEYYSSNLSREVKKGHTENALTGRHIGGIPPLGLGLDSEKHYIIDEAEAPAVRLIFRRKLEGRSYGEIQDELNSLGYRTKKGELFGKNSLHDILRNEKYAGTLVIRKTSPGNSRIAEDPKRTMRIENIIPAIMDRDAYDKVQEILDRATHSRPRNDQPLTYLLTGIVKCGVCGGAMTGRTVRKGREANNRGYYVCSRARHKKDCPNRQHYRKEPIEDAVLDRISRESRAIRDVDKMAEQLLKMLKKEYSGKNDQQGEIKRKLAKLEQEFSHFTKAIAAGADPRFLTDAINELGQQRERLKLELAQAGKRFDLDKQQIADFLVRKKAVRFDRLDKASCLQAIHEWIREVTVLPEGKPEVKLKGMV